MISCWIIHVWVGLLQMNRPTFNSIEVLTPSIDGLCQLEFLNFCPISHSALHHHSPIIKKVNNKYFRELWLIETFMANMRVLSIRLEISCSSLAEWIKTKVSGWLDVNDTTWRPLLKMGHPRSKEVSRLSFIQVFITPSISISSNSWEMICPSALTNNYLKPTKIVFVININFINIYF